MKYPPASVFIAAFEVYTFPSDGIDGGGFGGFGGFGGGCGGSGGDSGVSLLASTSFASS